MPMQKDTLKEYTVVEQMPVFPGGQDALMQWLINKISEIKTDSSCIPFKIYISFTVGANGAVMNPDVKTTSTYPVDCVIPAFYEKQISEEILKMPLWTPGKQNGEAVRVRFRIPIAFDYN